MRPSRLVLASRRARRGLFGGRRPLASVLLAMLVVAVSAVPPLNAGAEGAEPLTTEEAPREQTSYFFDFGSDRSPVMASYTRVTPADRYESERGYGLLATTEGYYVTARNVPEVRNFVLERQWVYDEYGDELTVDGVRSPDNVTFRVDLPNGSYRVRLWLGDLEQAVYSMNASYNGQWLIEGAAAYHLAKRGFYLDWSGDYPFDYGFARPYVREVEVTDGKLLVNVTGNDAAYWEGLAAERAKDPPCSYLSWMSQGALKCSPGSGPWRYIGGPFTNASVLGLEVYPVPELPLAGQPGSLALAAAVEAADLKAAVEALNEGDWEGAHAAWLEANGTALEGAELVARGQLALWLAGTLAGDYELEALPAAEADLAAALREDSASRGVTDLLDQVQRMRRGLHYEWNRTAWEPDPRQTKNHFYEADKAAMLLLTIEPDSPLYPKAQLWAARALMGLDPHRWTSASGTALEIMATLKVEWPDNPYLRFYTETNREDPPVWESPTSVISTTGEADEWYLMDYNAGYESAPQWAQLLRQELAWLYEVTDWWMEHRMQANGYLGGGWTDDVEFIGLFGFDALISAGADDLSLEGAGRFTEGMLASGGVDLDRGFSAAFADTEHSAELTGDSLPMMVATDFGNPKWIEFSYKTAQLMRDLWMGSGDLGWMFKANHLSATKVGSGSQAEDSWINFRAALPAYWVWWYNRDPEIEELLVRWAETWVNASLSTAKEKPEGVTPAMISWPEGEIGGLNAPNWYEGARNDGSVNYDWQAQQYKGYITTLLTSAYEATGDAKFLEPLRLEAELARAYLDDHGGREPEPGSARWAGKVLGQKAIDRYQALLDAFGLPGARPAATLWDREAVVEAVRNGHDYLRKCYPLMTTEASATDRVAFVGITNPFLIFTGGSAGGALLAPRFTYSGLGRDFAAMVMKADREAASLLLYGFFNETREAGLLLWDLEPGATYELRGGPDGDGDGARDSTDQNLTFVYRSRGMKVDFTLPGGREYVLDLQKLGDGTGAARLPDPAWGEEQPVVDPENGTLTVWVHNLGGAAAQKLKVALVTEGGEGQRLTLAEGLLAELLPPANLTLTRARAALTFARLPPEGLEGAAIYRLVLVIDPAGDLEQITTRNDQREVELDLTGVEVPPAPRETGGGSAAPNLAALGGALIIFAVGVVLVAGLWRRRGGSR